MITTSERSKPLWLREDALSVWALWYILRVKPEDKPLLIDFMLLEERNSLKLIEEEQARIKFLLDVSGYDLIEKSTYYYDRTVKIIRRRRTDVKYTLLGQKEGTIRGVIFEPGRG